MLDVTSDDEMRMTFGALDDDVVLMMMMTM